MAAPVLKGGPGREFQTAVAHTHPIPVVQIMVSQVIIGYRAWAITRRSKELGIFLLCFGVIVTGIEWYSNVDARIPVQDEVSVPHNAPLLTPVPDGSHLSPGKVRHSPACTVILGGYAKRRFLTAAHQETRKRACLNGYFTL